MTAPDHVKYAAHLKSRTRRLNWGYGWRPDVVDCWSSGIEVLLLDGVYVK